VRLALGASRWNLARQLLCESLLLSLLATVAAAGAAAACVPIAQSWIPASCHGSRCRHQWTSARVTAVIGLTAAVLSWIVPALQSVRDLEPALRRGGRTMSRAA